MKSHLLAAVLLVLGLYVIYREYVHEPVPIIQIVTGGAVAALIGAAWFYGAARRKRN
jgi:hypothetical protein